MAMLLDVRTLEEFTKKHSSVAINVHHETVGAEDVAELSCKERLISVC